MGKKIIYILPLIFVTTLASQTSNREEDRSESIYITSTNRINDHLENTTYEIYSNQSDKSKVETTPLQQDYPFLDMSVQNDHIVEKKNAKLEKQNKQSQEKANLRNSDSPALQKSQRNTITNNDKTDNISINESIINSNIDSSFLLFFQKRGNVKFNKLAEFRFKLEKDSIIQLDNNKIIQDNKVVLKYKIQDIITVGLFSIFLIFITLFLIKKIH